VSRSWWVVEIDESTSSQRWTASRYRNPNGTGFVLDLTDDGTAHRLTARLNERATLPPDPPRT
jgi:hypothetical protein